ncbi:MAG: hypothetical protein D6726_08310 [Nitrospirae bacterium]|nr:MAG: hypothetical protein D6726_08310 [Nitrospirota bacterium]
MVKKGFFTLILVFLLSDGLFAATFEVFLKNGTTGAPMAEYPIRILLVDKKSGGVVKTFEGKTDNKGIYREDIKHKEDTVLYSLITYRGVKYQYPIESGSRNKVLVYEITDQPKDTNIPGRTIIISPQDEHTIQVYDILLIENQGNKTLVERFNDKLDTNQVLNVPVPYGYRLNQLQGMSAEKIRTYGSSLITLEHIPPGKREYIFGYLIRSDTGLFNLEYFLL